MDRDIWLCQAMNEDGDYDSRVYSDYEDVVEWASNFGDAVVVRIMRGNQACVVDNAFEQIDNDFAESIAARP